MNTLTPLYNTLQERLRPEDVADMILTLLQGKLSTREAAILDRAARGSLARNYTGYTSMAQYFAGVVKADRQVKKAIEIFKLNTATVPDPAQVEDFVKEVSLLIQKNFGENNFETDRLNKLQRKEAGLDISKRAYNKRWRLLKRLEDKLLTIAREKRKLNIQLIAKHGLAHELAFTDFSSDEAGACFIAYYNARCNLRSEFTIACQQRPFDEIAEMLLARCNTSGTNWWAIAHIYPDQQTLSYLTDEQRGCLLGKWTAVLQDTAALLGEVWRSSDINQATMVVRKGNDSSTWNNTAGAWNKARDHWMHLIYAMGMDQLLNEICFGKVLRLMAGDVAWWHKITGGGLDEATVVWNELPLPWEVFEGKAHCNRNMIVEACRKARLDPEKSGWIAPRNKKVAAFRPTPELVHGVVVSNPFLATILKKHKYYSGK
ncbi:hypothetical protein HNQ91_000131 [Filimonas zeae]|uniref:Uncharacterized protein n=1 Tax=Filimonas zeae TaxID=1737353 RepID=A0A917IKD0_9BACT|nr:hypothetical protein [Filimonas zeae]MDR6337109.1 hypothetical protein [Filimonas zeae]GGH57047.1 hypothetical protein GCM10011379_01290 [Filimonas zeae]